MDSRTLCQRLACTMLACCTVAPVAAADSQTPSEFNVVVSQRLWNASWDQSVLDLVVAAPPTETSSAQLRAGFQKNVSSRNVPISAVALRYGRFTATLSGFATQRFAGNGIYAEPTIRRNETDLSIGYQLVPGVSVALIRKVGRTSANQTASATELFGVDPPADGRAWLLGLSGSAPINGHLAFYGNVAYGPGKFTDPSGFFVPFSSRYAVSEFGLAYQHVLSNVVLGLQSVTLQAGYRVQSISYHGYAPEDFKDVPAQVILANPRTRSVTDGFIVGVNLVF